MSVKILLLVVASTFFADQLSSLYDAHWSVAELSYNDPVYLTMSVLWFCIIVWLCHDIIKQKAHTPNTIKVLALIVGAFMAFEFIEDENTSFLLASFQFLEFGLWVLGYYIANFAVPKDWFTK